MISAEAAPGIGATSYSRRSMPIDVRQLRLTTLVSNARIAGRLANGQQGPSVAGDVEP
jgi:hypothetical protein